MTSSRILRLAGAASALALSFAAAAPAQAQSDGTAATGTGLNEIIVTAQKREQRLQDVPVSIVAIGGSQIEDMKITDLRSIQGYVPNLAVLNSGVNPVSTSATRPRFATGMAGMGWRST